MRYTAAHWGAYQIGPDDQLRPVAGDPAPSRIGQGWASAARDPGSRVLRPAVRAGWLAGDRGAARGQDHFIEMPWDEVLDLTAAEVARVRETHGNRAIYAGSYGWASAGRFHQPATHLRRFLNLVGGAVVARDSYSHAAAEVMFPHILGLSHRAQQDTTPPFAEVLAHARVILAFGGISPRTAQVAWAGTTRHELGDWLGDLRRAGVRLINVSPRQGDLPGAEWLAIRPGTDGALILALMAELDAAGLADEDSLARCTEGWPILRAWLRGETDGQPRNADWAAPLCDIPAEVIRDLARDLADAPSLISMAWGLQRAHMGEHVLWSGVALSAVLGQIGRPGCGFAFGYGATAPVGRDVGPIDWPAMSQGINPIADFIPVARVADMLLNPGGAYSYNLQHRQFPDIRLVWWAGGNPFHHHQDLRRLEQAWTRPETVIVNEHAWTATARRADIVLPATTPLERSDLMMSRSDTALLWMSPLHPPMGEARDDYDIFAGLAARMGVAEAFTEGRDAEAWQRHLWSRAMRQAAARGVTLPDFDTFRAQGRVDLPVQPHLPNPVAAFVKDPAGHPLKTPSGRITLFSPEIAEFGMADCPAHPAWIPLERTGPCHLLSIQSETRLHSQNDRGSEAQASKIQGREPAWIHPDTAQALGLAEGDVMRIWNARGACLAGVQLDAGLRRDCVVLPTGAWYDPQIVAGDWLEVHGNPNALTEDRGTSGMAQGNIAHTARVSLEKWLGPLPATSVGQPPPGIARQG